MKENFDKQSGDALIAYRVERACDILKESGLMAQERFIMLL